MNVQVNAEVIRAADPILLEATHADRGFVVLLDAKERPTFLAARHMSYAEIDTPEEGVSRSILHEVVSTGEGIALEDALEHPRFRGSASIANLRLRSVMAAPLRTGTGPLGAVYADGTGALFALPSDSLKVPCRVC